MPCLTTPQAIIMVALSLASLPLVVSLPPKVRNINPTVITSGSAKHIFQIRGRELTNGMTAVVSGQGYSGTFALTPNRRQKRAKFVLGRDLPEGSYLVQVLNENQEKVKGKRLAFTVEDPTPSSFTITRAFQDQCIATAEQLNSCMMLIDSEATIQGKPFPNDPVLKLNGQEVPIVASTKRKITFQVIRPNNTFPVNDNSYALYGELVVAEVCSKAFPTNCANISFAIEVFLVAGIGDSTVWGNGLTTEQKPHHIISEYIRNSKVKNMGVYSIMLARSGAKIVSNTTCRVAPLTGFQGELSCGSGGPSLHQQLSYLSQFPATQSNLRFVVLAGAYNDIGLDFPLRHTTKVQPRIREFAYVEMTRLLTRATKLFPCAQIVVQGYHQVLATFIRWELAIALHLGSILFASIETVLAWVFGIRLDSLKAIGDFDEQHWKNFYLMYMLMAARSKTVYQDATRFLQLAIRELGNSNVFYSRNPWGGWDSSQLFGYFPKVFGPLLNSKPASEAYLKQVYQSNSFLTLSSTWAHMDPVGAALIAKEMKSNINKRNITTACGGQQTRSRRDPTQSLSAVPQLLSLSPQTTSRLSPTTLNFTGDYLGTTTRVRFVPLNVNCRANTTSTTSPWLWLDLTSSEEDSKTQQGQQATLTTVFADDLKPTSYRVCVQDVRTEQAHDSGLTLNVTAAKLTAKNLPSDYRPSHNVSQTMELTCVSVTGFAPQTAFWLVQGDHSECNDSSSTLPAFVDSVASNGSQVVCWNRTQTESLHEEKLSLCYWTPGQSVLPSPDDQITIACGPGTECCSFSPIATLVVTVVIIAAAVFVIWWRRRKATSKVVVTKVPSSSLK
eukprot:m.22491 g.22491  ORF g.22491 m.22491 type:complete len:840 (+) comp12953_c0_seq2:190-2709(+)